MTSPDGTLIGPPPTIPEVTDPAGNVYSISHPDGYVVRNGRLCNGKALFVKLVGPDIFVKSPKGLLFWHKVLGYNSWWSSGSPVEPGTVIPPPPDPVFSFPPSLAMIVGVPISLLQYVSWALPFVFEPIDDADKTLTAAGLLTAKRVAAGTVSSAVRLA